LNYIYKHVIKLRMMFILFCRVK